MFQNPFKSAVARQCFFYFRKRNFQAYCTTDCSENQKASKAIKSIFATSFSADSCATLIPG